MELPPNSLQGKKAEQAACQFLTGKGLRLIEANYRYAGGEIDLIMQHGEYIVFIEVRSRDRWDYGNPLESIDENKQRKIVKTALYFLQEREWLEKVYCRFDVIGVKLIADKMTIEWIDNAFTTEHLINL